MARSREIAGFDGLPHLPLAAAGLEVGGGGGLCSGGGAGLGSTGGGGGLCSGGGVGLASGDTTSSSIMGMGVCSGGGGVGIPSKPSMFALGVKYGIGLSAI